LEGQDDRKSHDEMDKRLGSLIMVFAILTAGNSADLLFISFLCKKKGGLPGFATGQDPDYLDDSDEIQGVAGHRRWRMCFWDKSGDDPGEEKVGRKIVGAFLSACFMLRLEACWYGRKRCFRYVRTGVPFYATPDDRDTCFLQIIFFCFLQENNL